MRTRAVASGTGHTGPSAQEQFKAHVNCSCGKNDDLALVISCRKDSWYSNKVICQDLRTDLRDSLIRYKLLGRTIPSSRRFCRHNSTIARNHLVEPNHGHVLD